MILNTKPILDLVYQLRVDFLNYAKEWGVDIPEQYAETKETRNKKWVDENGHIDSQKNMEDPFDDITLDVTLPTTEEALRAIAETLAKCEAYVHGLLYTDKQVLVLSADKRKKFQTLHRGFMDNSVRNLKALKQKIDRNEVNDPRFYQLVERLLMFTNDLEAQKCLDVLHFNDLPWALRKAAQFMFIDYTTNDKTVWPHGQPVNFAWGQERVAKFKLYLNKAKESYEDNLAAIEREERREQLEREQQQREQLFAEQQQGREQLLNYTIANREQQQQERAEEREDVRKRNARIPSPDANIQLANELLHDLSLIIGGQEEEIDASELAKNLQKDVALIQKYLEPVSALGGFSSAKNTNGINALTKLINDRLEDVIQSLSDAFKQKVAYEVRLAQIELLNKIDSLQNDRDKANFNYENIIAGLEKQVQDLKDLHEKDILEMQELAAKDKFEAEVAARADGAKQHQREIEAMKLAKVKMWDGVSKHTERFLKALIFLTFPVGLPIYFVVRHFKKRAAKFRARQFLLAPETPENDTPSNLEANAADAVAKASQPTNLVANVQDMLAQLKTAHPRANIAVVVTEQGQEGARPEVESRATASAAA